MMTDREKVIKGLECCTKRNPEDVPRCGECPYQGACLNRLKNDALALLKAQETSLEKVADDYGLTVDGVAFALEQYQTIICEITHGMMSKLTYRACDVLQVAQERWCDTCELKEAPEPRLLQAADFQREDADIGGGIPCWKETRSPTRRNGWAVIVYGKWLADAGIARYWTGKPTQAQMESTPWLTEEE